MSNDQKRDREETISFAMNYCRHYKPQGGIGNYCVGGMDSRTIQKVQTGPKSIKWGPCVEGHMLADPLTHCPKWERVTREAAEKRADLIEESMQRMTKAGPVVSAWRNKPPRGKSEVIECPVCKGRLHLAQASSNGHVRGACETTDCLNWIE